MKPLYSFVAMLCISLLFSCAPEIEPIPELEYSSSSGTSSSNVVVLGSSSSSSRVSSSSVVISGSSSSVKPSSGTYCLDYDWQECTLSNGNPCPDWSTPSNSCPSGWDIYNSSSNSKPSSSSVKPSSSSAMPSSSSVVVPSSSSAPPPPPPISSSISIVPSSSSAVPYSSSVVVVSSSSSVVTGTGLCAGFANGTTRVHYGKEKAQFCDERDGTKYVYVTIGEQTWMAENLNYNASGSKCYSNSEANCTTYGRLYNWVTAMDIASTYSSSLYSVSGNHKGICPSGWHIPNIAEWDKMTRYVDGTSGTSSPYKSLTAGKYLKATSGWNNNGNGIDTYGFTALPGGDCNSGGGFARVGHHGLYWNTTELNATAAHRPGFGQNDDISTTVDTEIKPWLLSVRCLKD